MGRMLAKNRTEVWIPAVMLAMLVTLHSFAVCCLTGLKILVGLTSLGRVSVGFQIS